MTAPRTALRAPNTSPSHAGAPAGTVGYAQSSHPPNGATIHIDSGDLTIGELSMVLEPAERIERETCYSIGITENAYEVEVEGKSSAIVGPDVIRVHAAGDYIRTHAGGEIRSIWAVLSESLLEDLLSCGSLPAPLERAFIRPTLPLLGDFRAFFSRASTGGAGLWAQEAIVELMPRLLGDVAEAYRQRAASPAQTRLARDCDAMLGQEFRRIKSLVDLSRRLHVSASYLARSYRRATGASLHSKVTRLRIAEALRCLGDGATNLTTLALDLGYSSHSHFSAEFRRHIGRSPSDLRLKMQI